MRQEHLYGPRTPKALSFQPNYVVADAVAAAFRRHSIESLFGQSIPSSLMLAVADIGIRQVVYRTENAGTAMADGYARISRRIGVVTAQNGPAATLLVPGLAEAFKSSIPILAIVQDVPRQMVDRNAFQELDHMSLFAGSAKWIRRAERQDRIGDLLDQAITAALTGRPGPVVLLLPMDLLVEETEPSTARRMGFGTVPLDRMAPGGDAVEQAARLLAAARRPVVIAGGGIHLSGAHEQLAQLQELAGLPVGTTIMGKGGVDEGHPLSLGVIGNAMGKRGMSRYLRTMIKDADVVLLAATRTAQNGTDSWSLYGTDAQFIHIDIDGLEVGRNYEAVRLVGDARLTLEALNAKLAGTDLSLRQSQRPAVEGAIAEARRLHREDADDVLTSDRSPIRPERIMAETDKVLTPQSIVTADASFSSVWFSNYLRAQQPGMRFLAPRGQAG
ncbi:MAG TPA: thiamine pyrophosphate-binding protein, partial [Devosia sp.]|nr:thiamine pyrophosphate-binding protein [Devosia sp.]